MTILFAHVKDDIRLDFGVWLAKRAWKHRCEQADVLAILNPPSHPTSTPKAHIVPDGSHVDDERPTSLPGTDGAEDRAPIQAGRAAC